MDEEARFRSEIERSVPAAEAVAGYFRTLGFEAEVPPLVVRPTFQDRAQYGDGGKDVLIWKPGLTSKHKVEVKRRRLQFTSADDFPFPTLYVDRVSKTTELARLYVTVNEPLTRAAIVSLRTREEWGVVLTTAQEGYTPYEVYVCPVEYVQFVDLVQPNHKPLDARAAYWAKPGDDTIRAALDTCEWNR